MFAPSLALAVSVLAPGDAPAPSFRWGLREPSTLQLDAPELIGTVKPGLLTWWRELSTGRKQHVDYWEYYPPTDPLTRYLDRQHGVYYRDPSYWP